MRLGSLALLCLGSVALLGLEAAQLDAPSNFKRMWSKWALSRARREPRASPLVSPRDVQDEPRVALPSRPEDSHIRVRRNQNQNPSGHTCRFGTCTLNRLAHRIYLLTDKDKDISAPPKKISPQGYGRRRRSLWEVLHVNAALGGSSLLAS